MEDAATYSADSMSAEDLLRLAGIGPGETDRTRPPAPAAMIASEEELTAARLSPRCIVRHLVYADVAVLVAPSAASTRIMTASARHGSAKMTHRAKNLPSTISHTDTGLVSSS